MGWGFTGGVTYVVNINEGWVAEYEHVGPYISLGLSPVTRQVTMGQVNGSNMSSPRFYDGWFREFSMSALGSYATATAVTNDPDNWITQEGAGFETTYGVSAYADFYYLVNVMYVKGDK